MSEQSAIDAVESIYAHNDGNPVVEAYAERHGIESMMILTVMNQEAARREVDTFRSQIEGKAVVEIGAGVGFLALEIARSAKSIVAIEADAAWSWIFTAHLYGYKPKNLTWIFGDAKQAASYVRGDVAVVYARSDIKGLRAIAARMCPRTIMGPNLSAAERFPEATEEEIALAESFARNMKPEDLVSRRGISAATIRRIARP